MPLSNEGAVATGAPENALSHHDTVSHNELRSPNQASSQIEPTVDLAGTARIVIPKRKRGAQSVQAQQQYEAQLQAFSAGILQIRSTIDFDVSSRGWGYLLESHGVTKGEFDAVQKLITNCRKSGDLPLDICAEDARRSTDNLESLDGEDPLKHADNLIEGLRNAYQSYTPFSFWDAQDHYVEQLVEKVDLRNLFGPVCEEYYVPITNAVGWSDVNLRAAMMKRFAYWESRGKQCVLTYCGDHDPGGLNISDFLRSNMEELADAVGWSPDNLIIERFGLNYDFIIEQGLTWIDNLETSSGDRLDNPKHPDHTKPYVQEYIRRYGVRKVEANALVVRPQEGRDLCRAAINQYVPETAPDDYRRALAPKREELHQIIERILRGAK
jgi:hypothetical protein